jgi:hypothetical protein
VPNQFWFNAERHSWDGRIPYRKRLVATKHCEGGTGRAELKQPRQTTFLC